MPWSKVPGSETDECDAGQIAVIKDEDESVEGCHDTEEEADDQIAALNASENEMNAFDQVESLLEKADASETASEDPPDKKSAVGEQRRMSFHTKSLEVKEDGDEEFVFEGYGAVFGNKDRGGDIIQPGAFKRTIDRNDSTFPLVTDHDLTMKSRVGVVYAEEDQHGVKVDAHVNTDKRLGKEVASDIRHAQKHGESVGMSFGYEVKKDDYDAEKDARLLKEVKTYEFSLTQIPMNPQAEVTGVKAILQDDSALEELARKLAPLLADEKQLITALTQELGAQSATDTKSGSVAELADELNSLTSKLQTDG